MHASVEIGMFQQDTPHDRRAPSTIFLELRAHPPPSCSASRACPSPVCWEGIYCRSLSIDRQQVGSHDWLSLGLMGNTQISVPSIFSIGSFQHLMMATRNRIWNHVAMNSPVHKVGFEAHGPSYFYVVKWERAILARTAVDKFFSRVEPMPPQVHEPGRLDHIDPQDMAILY